MLPYTVTSPSIHGVSTSPCGSSHYSTSDWVRPSTLFAPSIVVRPSWCPPGYDTHSLRTIVSQEGVSTMDPLRILVPHDFGGGQSTMPLPDQLPKSLLKGFWPVPGVFGKFKPSSPSHVLLFARFRCGGVFSIDDGTRFTSTASARPVYRAHRSHHWLGLQGGRGTVQTRPPRRWKGRISILGRRRGLRSDRLGSVAQ